ncbi:hypothetical protein E2C01_021503 [Portunus trituberculatus]|uniref:Uncharacterized protein n=1 Tax=Portunus trituberculatus TaxID=210409 RepID=A0A5B7E2P9_PORTR|nr:hypothetical protein [Portunus trituberculatus]
MALLSLWLQLPSSPLPHPGEKEKSDHLTFSCRCTSAATQQPNRARRGTHHGDRHEGSEWFVSLPDMSHCGRPRSCWCCSGTCRRAASRQEQLQGLVVHVERDE